MKAFITLTCLLALCLAEQNKWGVEHKDQVSTLTADNFKDFIKKHKYVFVKFYAPWCGHRKSMAPSYAKLAEKMNNKEDGIPIADLDATEHGSVAEEFNVQGYPTLKFFIDGVPVDYNGEREGDAIENFINKKINPASKALTKVEELKELESSKLSAVLVTAGAEADQLATFNTFSSAYDTPFYNAAFPEALTQTGAAGKYNFVVFRNFDEGKKVLSSDKPITADEMKAFWDSVRNPTLMEFDQDTAEKIFGGEETTVFLFTDKTESAELSTFSEVAKEKKGTLIFCKSTIKGGLGERLAEYLGISSEDENLMVIVNFEGGNPVKYRLSQWDKSSAAKFIDDFKAGSLKPFFKSDPIPESNSEPVKVIVGNNFESMVLKSDKHVLLEVYAPWCGHCKKLAPIYDKLAKVLADQEDIVIAKMDGTTNEHELVAIKGFPTIKFFKKSDPTHPIDFEGDRTLDGFLFFLEKETNRKLIDNIKASKIAEDQGEEPDHDHDHDHHDHDHHDHDHSHDTPDDL